MVVPGRLDPCFGEQQSIGIAMNRVRLFIVTMLSHFDEVWSAVKLLYRKPPSFKVSIGLTTVDHVLFTSTNRSE